MALDYLSDFTLNSFIQLALAEDVGDGDFSSLACVPAESAQTAELIMKADGVLAGVGMAERIFLKVDPSLDVRLYFREGAQVKSGDVVLTVEGSAQSILKAERLVLNCMQRMSGIATFTQSLTRLIEGTGAKLLDTRKTTPNFRPLEKWAVVIGGGYNHRYNLADMVMLKDNHIDFAGGITQALEKTRAFLDAEGKDLKIEVETRNLEEVKEVLSTGIADRVMFDNMSVEEMTAAVALVGDALETEASGGITESTIRAIAETGVNFISVGALTHSVKSLDMSLKAKLKTHE